MVRLRELGCVSCDVIIDVIVAACPPNANFGRAKGGPLGARHSAGSQRYPTCGLPPP